MKTVKVNPADLSVGQHVTVWYESGRGQGGTFASVTDDTITIETPMGSRSWPCNTVNELTAEVPFDADECLEFDPGRCDGPVDFHSVGQSLRAWPRCTHHAELRQQRYENSIERYADSDVVPEWFDPSAVGEHWDDD